MNSPNESPLNTRLSKMIRESRHRRSKRCKIAFIAIIAVFFIVMIVTSQPSDEASSKKKKSSQNQKLSSLEEKQSLRNAAKNYIKSKSRSQSKSKSISDAGQRPPQKSVHNFFHQSHSKTANKQDNIHDYSNLNQTNKVKIIQQLSKKKLDTFKLIPMESSTKSKSINTFALNKNDIYSKAFGNKLKNTSSNLLNHLFGQTNTTKTKNKTTSIQNRYKDPVMASTKNTSLKSVYKIYKLNATQAKNRHIAVGLDSKISGQFDQDMEQSDQSLLKSNTGIEKKHGIKKGNQARHMRTQVPIDRRVGKKKSSHKLHNQINRKGGIMTQDDSDDDTFDHEDELDQYEEQDPYEEVSRKTVIHPKSKPSKHRKTSNGNQRFKSINRQNKNRYESLELDDNENEHVPKEQQDEELSSEQHLQKSSSSKTSFNRHGRKKTKGQTNQRWKQQPEEDEDDQSFMDYKDRHFANQDSIQDRVKTTDEDSDSAFDDSDIERLPTKKTFKTAIHRKKTTNTTKRYGQTGMRHGSNRSANNSSMKKKSSKLSTRYGHQSNGRKYEVGHDSNRFSGRHRWAKKGENKGHMPSVTRYVKKDHESDSFSGENGPWQMLRQPKSINSPLENQHRVILRPTKSKTILIWSRYPHRHQSEAAIDLPCGQHHCRVVRDSRQYTRSSAVIFQNYRKEFSSFHYFPNMRVRPEGQLWIYHNRRSPVYNQRIHLKILRFHLALFNLVMSHTHDADLIHHYGSITKGNYQSDFDSQRNYASGKSKLIAYYSSSCNHQTKTFLNHLRQYLPIDAYGSCGNITCSNGTQQCMQMIARQYKFLLIMEDSLCRDYSTQQLYLHGLRYDIVPVVVGGANYDDPTIAPPYSVINVFNYASGYDLSKYLNRLDQDDTLYNHYFSWRLHYKVNKGNDISDLCGLCNNLYNEKWVKEKSQSTHYDLWNKWGDAENNCVVYPTRLNGQTRQKLTDMYARAERHRGKYIL